MKFPKSRKHEPNFATGSTVTKVNREHSEKVTKRFLKNVLTLTLVSMATVELMIGIFWFLNMWHMSSWKNKKTFGNTGSKPFIQKVLMKKRSTYIDTRTYLSYSLRFHLISKYTFFIIITIIAFYLFIQLFVRLSIFWPFHKLMSVSCICFYFTSFLP